MVWRDLLALIATFILALLWLRFNDYLAHQGWMTSWTSRKSIHIGTGPLFMLCWLLFSQAAYVRWLASLVPLSITVQFILVGLGMLKDDDAVKAMSRSGDPREILRGPVYYGVVFVALTLVFWLDHPAGVIALSLLCAGDGAAEIVGRKYGGSTLPWNHSKSWAGSTAFLVAGFGLSIGLLSIFILSGAFSITLSTVILPVLAITAVCALVESVTPHSLDNLSVPLAAVLLSVFLF